MHFVSINLPTFDIPWNILTFKEVHKSPTMSGSFLVMDGMSYTCFFISIVFFNLRLEYPSVFHKSSLKICLKYGYLRTFKRANFMILPTPVTREFIESMKMKKF